jgi:hypothetical protein
MMYPLNTLEREMRILSLCPCKVKWDLWLLCFIAGNMLSIMGEKESCPIKSKLTSFEL